VVLLGTKTVMSADFQRQRYEELGIGIITPSEADMDTIDRIIFDELCVGVFKDESKQRYLEIIDSLVEQGAEGAILGCTEIPLLINQQDLPNVPMFDTMALHVAAAVDRALQ
jgi:aspartate racemase